MFKKLILENWRQFDNINISFHPNLTILTGANGAGKTTLLNILAENLGWPSNFVSSYQEYNGKLHYTNSFDSISDDFNKSSYRNNSIKIGEIVYDDDNVGHIKVPKNVNETYRIIIDHNKKVPGLFINSHRPTFPYRMLNTIPATTTNRATIFNNYYNFAHLFAFDEYRDRQKISSTSLVKETLASLAMFGYGNKAVSKNSEMQKLFEGYETILRKVLPKNLGFNNIKVVTPEVMLCTNTGTFPIDAVSGGISSIIDITWQIFMYADSSASFVVVLDEPENHLHPELQKTLLSNLIEVFPHVQFIVATHNPFMISAVKDSNVFVLNYNDKQKVSSYQLDHINRAGTSDAILRDVLGIESSIPFWAETKLNSVISDFSKKPFNQETIDELRTALSEIGLDHFIPETIAKLVMEMSND